jgi:nicotinamidase-related amidase
MASTSTGTDTPVEELSPIGNNPSNSWLYDPATGLIDLTRKDSTSDPTALILKTTTHPIRINPTKTALIIIDMQNFFLSSALGRPTSSAGLAAADALLTTGIHAARDEGIRVVWVNWGLTDEEVDTMPPSIIKAFGVYEVPASSSYSENTNSNLPKRKKKVRTIYKGLGVDLGPVELDDGTTVEAGRVLMRDTWNAALYPPLDGEYRKGLRDVWIHKNRMSALWGQHSELQDFLDKEGLTTLLFAGVNTDQCVGGTLADAFSKGFDCILLKDAVATTSPQFATDSWEWNCANTYGFVTSCGALRRE